MWFLVLLGTAGYCYFVSRIYKLLNASKKSIAEINKNLRWYNKSKESHISEAIDTAVINGSNITSDDFEPLDIKGKIDKLNELRENDEYLKDDERFSQLVGKIEFCDIRIKDKKHALSRQIDSYNDSLEQTPAKFFAKYLGFKRELAPGQKERKRKTRRKERLAFLRDYLPENVVTIIKIAIDVFCVDFAILTIHYCTLGNKRNSLVGLICFLLLALYVYLRFAKKRFRRIPLWSATLLLGFVCIIGIAFHKEPNTEAEDAPIPILLDINKPKANIESPYAIAQVLDIDNETINRLNQRAWTDLQNGFNMSVGNTLNNKMDYMLEVITKNNQTLPNFLATNNDERSFSKKNISMNSITLCTPKNTTSPQGLIKINYKLDIGFTWKDESGKAKNIFTPVYVSYVWNINLNNKTQPISDYSKFKFDYINADTDYGKWSQKNIDNEKAKYNVDVRIMHK